MMPTWMIVMCMVMGVLGAVFCFIDAYQTLRQGRLALKPLLFGVAFLLMIYLFLVMVVGVDFPTFFSGLFGGGS